MLQVFDRSVSRQLMGAAIRAVQQTMWKIRLSQLTTCSEAHAGSSLDFSHQIMKGLFGKRVLCSLWISTQRHPIAARYLPHDTLHAAPQSSVYIGRGLGVGLEPLLRSFRIVHMSPECTSGALKDRNFSSSSLSWILLVVLVSSWSTSRSTKTRSNVTQSAFVCSVQTAR